MYLALAMVCFFVTITKPASPLHRAFGFDVSDGRFYYAYLPSLVLDGDLDFSNQIREHWETSFDPELLSRRTERGLVQNRYPIGMALSAAPGFLAGHAVACALHPLLGWDSVAPDGYSPPYQLFSFLWLTLLGVGAICLADFLLRNCFGCSPGATVLGTLVYWGGSPLLYYMTREPFMAHVASSFWVNLCLVQLYLLGRKNPPGELTPVRAFLVTVSFSMALICRPTNFFLAPFFLYALARLVRTGQLGRLPRVVPAAVLGVAPLAAQSLVWHAMTGFWIHYSYRAQGFYWLEPALWQTLFSSRHGLFFWSPLLILAVPGFAWRLASTGRRPEPFLVCSLAGLAILWYMNSAWHCWWFGAAFGARAFVEGAAILAAGCALLFDRARQLPRSVHVFGLGVIAAGLLGEVTLVGLYAKGWIPHDGYLFQEQPADGLATSGPVAGAESAASAADDRAESAGGSEESEAGTSPPKRESATSTRAEPATSVIRPTPP
jgi:hypothetical protein